MLRMSDAFRSSGEMLAAGRELLRRFSGSEETADLIMLLAPAQELLAAAPPRLDLARREERVARRQRALAKRAVDLAVVAVLNGMKVELGGSPRAAEIVAIFPEGTSPITRSPLSEQGRKAKDVLALLDENVRGGWTWAEPLLLRLWNAIAGLDAAEERLAAAKEAVLAATQAEMDAREKWLGRLRATFAAAVTRFAGNPERVQVLFARPSRARGGGKEVPAAAEAPPGSGTVAPPTVAASTPPVVAGSGPATPPALPPEGRNDAA